MICISKKDKCNKHLKKFRAVQMSLRYQIAQETRTFPQRERSNQKEQK